MKMVIVPLFMLAPVLAASAQTDAFKRYDKNDDNKITTAELGMPAVFERADKNDDGFVTADEFVAFLEQRNGNRVQRQATIHTGASEILVVNRDIRYRNTPRVAASSQSLDIYAPKDAKNLPVMIYIHGGGWQRGDKAAVGLKPEYFCSRDWVFVSLNYRFVPAVDLLTQLQDSAHAIAWVHTHIADHGGDPQRLHLMGHSRSRKRWRGFIIRSAV